MSRMIPAKTMETIKRRGASLADEGYRVVSDMDGVTRISDGSRQHVLVYTEQQCDCELWKIYGWCSHLEGLPGLLERMDTVRDEMTLRPGDRSLPALRGEHETGLAMLDMGLAETLEMARTLAASGFFADSREAAQAFTKIWAGRELGIPAVASMTGIYIVKGRITLSANLIAGALKRSQRYDYRVVEHDAKHCIIEFTERGQQIGLSEFTIEDAGNAGLLANETYKKFPKNMLFSRALSNGARWFTPDVFSGPVYTPDEMGAAVDTNTGEIIDVPPSPRQQSTRPTNETVETPTTSTSTTNRRPTSKEAAAAFKARCELFGYTGEPIPLLTELLGQAPEAGKVGKACLKALEVPEGGWKAAVARLQPATDEDELDEKDPFEDEAQPTAQA